MPTNDDPVSIRRAGPDFRLPNGARIGIVFNIAYEAWSPGKAPGSARWATCCSRASSTPTRTPGATTARCAASSGCSRSRRQQGQRPASWSAACWPSAFPTRVRADPRRGPRDRGPLLRHGHHPGLSRRGRRRSRNIRRTTALIAAAGGHPPAGWISPRGTGSPSQPAPAGRRRATSGTATAIDDDLPPSGNTLTGGGRIVAIPLTMDVNDLPHSNRYGGSAEAFVGKFQAHSPTARRRRIRPPSCWTSRPTRMSTAGRPVPGRSMTA